MKSIRVLEFTGKITDWEGWSVKFLARGKRLGYKKLLLGKEKIPTESEYQKAVMENDKNTTKRAELNEQAYGDIILSVNPEKHGFGRAYVKRYYHRRRDKDEKASSTSEEEHRLIILNMEGPSLSQERIWVRLPLCRRESTAMRGICYCELGKIHL